jgi:hypothetical protein
MEVLKKPSDFETPAKLFANKISFIGNHRNLKVLPTTSSQHVLKEIRKARKNILVNLSEKREGISASADKLKEAVMKCKI